MSMTAKQLVSEAREMTESVPPEQVKDGLILDVREADELSSQGKIDGAIHVPRGTLEMKADEETGVGEESLLAARRSDRPVFVMCASGARSALAAVTLKRMGYTAKFIEGGLEAWKKAGKSVSR